MICQQTYISKCVIEIKKDINPQSESKIQSCGKIFFPKHSNILVQDPFCVSWQAHY